MLDYKEELGKEVNKKKKEIPTAFSEIAVTTIFKVLEETPVYLTSLAKHFDDHTSLEPIIEGKRSFKETLIHLLHMEALHYITIYPAFLLNKPKIYSIHAERDLSRLSLFSDFQPNELLETFCYERRKSLNFLKSLKKSDWHKALKEENKAREETIYWRARVLALHDFTHTQILKLQTKKLGNK